jgi:hypothetical protein
MSSAAFGKLSADTLEQVHKYLTFFRQKKDALLRTIMRELNDMKNDTMEMGDITFSKEDMENFADTMISSIRGHMSGDLGTIINMGMCIVCLCAMPCHVLPRPFIPMPTPHTSLQHIAIHLTQLPLPFLSFSLNLSPSPRRGPVGVPVAGIGPRKGLRARARDLCGGERGAAGRYRAHELGCHREAANAGHRATHLHEGRGKRMRWRAKPPLPRTRCIYI